MRINSFVLLAAILLTTLSQTETLRAQEGTAGENVLSQAGDLPKQLAELNIKRRDALEEILRNGEKINNLELAHETTKNIVQFHIGAEYYKPIIQALENVKAGKASEGDKEYITNSGYDYSSGNLENNIRSLQAEFQKELQETNQLAQLENDLQTARDALSDSRQKATLIESRIDRVLSEADEGNEFRLFISVAFTLLVAFVIAGFYFIAFKNKVVADAFGGEKGIQFITLFLVVIAIILFGIMGVFGGKELSALLGALSGYILGRTTSGSPASPAPNPASDPPQNPAPKPNPE